MADEERMTFEDFHEKLYPFFTDEQIKNMADYTLANAEEFSFCYGAHGYYEGYNGFCVALMDMTATEIREIAGGIFPDSLYEALQAQFEICW